MLAEVFMIWVEQIRRQGHGERTTTPSTSPFVPLAALKEPCSKNKVSLRISPAATVSH
jgi:hypothetical protein